MAAQSPATQNAEPEIQVVFDGHQAADLAPAALKAALADHLKTMRELAGAEASALSASRTAHHKTLAAAYGARRFVGNDAATIRTWIEAAGLEATKALLANPALAVVKGAYGVDDNKRASDAAAVLRGLEAEKVAVEDAFELLEQKGSVAVAKLGRKPKADAADAKDQKAKVARLMVSQADLGTASGIDLPVAPGESGYVVLVAEPDGNGGFKVRGAVNDDGTVDRVVALAAKNVKL